LEPGLDGVGDYTRQLAGQLAQRGHACLLIALADPHVGDVQREEMAEGARRISVLRIPSLAPWPERVAVASSARESFAPDWISFQLVPFAFDPRGLCFGLGKQFRAIAGDIAPELMFHEIWIGEAEGTPFQRRLIGRLQRFILRDLVRKLRPRVLHTHTPLYRHLLGTLGLEAKILPLFANIVCPEGAKSDPGWLAEKWPAGWGRMNASGREKWLLFVLFGSIHPEWDAEDFQRRASQAAAALGKHVAFLSIGRAGPDGDAALEKLRRHDGPDWMTHSLGPQAPADITQCLLAADFGLASVPPEYVTKSGTVMAMLEHGLPVLVTRPPYRYRSCPEQLLEPGLANLHTDFDLAAARKTPARQMLPQVAEQFVADLRAG
jgi:hypothetical protein